MTTGADKIRETMAKTVEGQIAELPAVLEKLRKTDPAAAAELERLAVAKGILIKKPPR